MDKKKNTLESLASIEKEAKELRKIIENCNETKCITDKVKTFEDACSVLGVNPKFYDDDSKFIIACKKLEIIVQALNEGWHPNWDDENEHKYYPYFQMIPFGFVGTDYGGWGSDSNVGSRLCFKNIKLAKYAATQFEDLYKDFLN